MLSIPPAAKSSLLSTIVREDISSTLQFSDINKDFKDFKASMQEVIKSNLSLLDEVPLPKSLRIDDMRAFFRKQIEKDLTEDPLFEKSVELTKYANNMGQSMESYFAEIFNFNEDRIKNLHSKTFETSKMFLNSDLPVSFMTLIADSHHTEIDYIGIFNREIRREYLDLIRSRSNKTKFERVIDAHNSWVRSFTEQRQRMERDRVKLCWYVDFNNSKDVDEIFQDKFIKTSNLDRQTFSSFIQNLQTQNREMQRINSKLMKFSLPSSEMDDETETFMQMMNILKG